MRNQEGNFLFPLLKELEIPEKRPSGVSDDCQPDAERGRTKSTLLKSSL
jgi:hypothetical protein